MKNATCRVLVGYWALHLVIILSSWIVHLEH
jgi:hypothetical protein